MEQQSQALQPIEHNNQRILTTRQLAEFYGADEKIIQRNFQRNHDRYTEGKHFYRLEGEMLRQFIEVCGRQIDAYNEQNLSKIRVLYLWTEKGALQHAKSLNTDQAWSIYETLVDTYYRLKELAAPEPLPPVFPPQLLRAHQAMNEWLTLVKEEGEHNEYTDAQFEFMRQEFAQVTPEDDVQWKKALTQLASQSGMPLLSARPDDQEAS